MAKWGEGDPRWVVEERSDAHNVNNWHWREVDSSEWSKDFLKEALKENIKLDDGNLVCNVTEINTLEGESSSCVRKAKFITIFEWEKIICKWSGRVAGVDTEFKGSITIENFDHDSDSNEIDITVKFETGGPARHPALEAMIKKNSPEKIWKAFTSYKKELVDHFKSKLAFSSAPKPETAGDQSNNSTIKSSPETKNATETKKPTAIKLKTVSTSPKKEQQVGAKIVTKKITISETFQGEIQDVYSAFTDVNKMKVWSQGSLKLSFCENSHEIMKDTKYTLFSDSIWACITRVNKPGQISMEWRQKAWPEAHWSLVEMSFESVSGGTKLTVEQKHVPAEFVSQTQEGWRRYYFAAIKSTMGLGGCRF